ncbi:hypothetical protein BDN71DRAFT_730724 [Pleurotus eryngii]|uniref:Uncharacterized protein n=1 Tax=Pleurotus eryngii TaxID=5323 RepID=A0A9P6DHN3_PLEER|nr:hypothetical protein BDN71DRAFT_730724 [Pleurotus eryngii]
MNKEFTIPNKRHVRVCADQSKRMYGNRGNPGHTSRLGSVFCITISRYDSPFVAALERDRIREDSTNAPSPHKYTPKNTGIRTNCPPPQVGEETIVANFCDNEGGRDTPSTSCCLAHCKMRLRSRKCAGHLGIISN